MLLSGHVAVVTGGGRGIGREFALCLAREGAAVVVDDIGMSVDGRVASGDPAADVCAEIRDFGGRALACRESVSDFGGARRIVERTVAKFGRLDILVNNAGNLRNAFLLEMREEDFDAVIGVHLKGTFNVTRHAAPIMRAQRHGRIINITSRGGLQGNKGHTNYGAAKAGVMAMTFVWALELAAYGITVNAMAPQSETRMTSKRMQRLGVRARAAMNPALNAPLVAYLASDRAAGVNGQVFSRKGFAYTLFQTPRPIASMWKFGGWTPEEIACQFDTALGQHLQPVGRDAMRSGMPASRVPG
jgi:NAD(P)-dependent dehydrogenase (short-subunit alcohol dehydrogenase family)